MRRWFSVPRGTHHRVPEPGSGRAAVPVTGTVKVLPPAAPPPADTVAFDASELWTGPLPAQKPATTAGPPPLVSAVVFHPGISRSLRRDHTDLPLFRQTVKARGGFAGLHMRAPTAPIRGKKL